MQHPLIRRIAAIALATLACTAIAHADDTFVAPVDEAFETAQAQYAQGRYGEAFGNFYWAAIRDHAQAQEIVGMMYLLGPKVYGPAIRADREEARFWLGEAGRRGREVGRHMQCALANSDKRVLAPALARACARD